MLIEKLLALTAPATALLILQLPASLPEHAPPLSAEWDPTSVLLVVVIILRELAGILNTRRKDLLADRAADRAAQLAVARMETGLAIPTQYGLDAERLAVVSRASELPQ